MTKGVIFKVKSEHLERWRTWCEELMTSLQGEALITLREEQILQEASFLFELSGKYYIFGFVDGECLPGDMTKEINIKHKKIKEECLERISEAEVLYNLKV